jgi:hypothetical protein
MITIARISQRAGAPVQGVDQAGKPHPGGHEVTGEVSRNRNVGPARFTKLIDPTLRVAQKVARHWLASSIPRRRVANSHDKTAR